MTREEFLAQAESVRPGITNVEFVDAVKKDAEKCMELSKQGKMYPVKKIANDATEEYIRHKKYFSFPAWFFMLFDYEEPNQSEPVKNRKGEVTPYLINIAPFEVAYLAAVRCCTVDRQSIFDTIAKILLMDIDSGKVHYEIFDKPLAIPAPTSGVIDESIVEEVLNSTETEDAIKKLSEEVSAAYNLVMGHIKDVSEAEIKALVELLGKDIVDRVRSGKETAETLWMSVLEKLIDKDTIMKSGISENELNRILQKVSESGIAHKIIEMINAVASAADKFFTKQNVANTQRAVQASVNHAMLNGQRLSPKDIADRLSRSKAGEVPVHQQPVQNPIPQPQQQYVDPLVQQQAEYSRLQAEKMALGNMIWFSKTTALFPQEIHDLYHIMTSEKLQAELDTDNVRIIRNINAPYLWEVESHPEFDKSKYRIAFAAESFHKDYRVLLLVNIMGKEVDILMRPLMQIAKPVV